MASGAPACDTLFSGASKISGKAMPRWRLRRPVNGRSESLNEQTEVSRSLNRKTINEQTKALHGSAAVKLLAARTGEEGVGGGGGSRAGEGGVGGGGECPPPQK